MRLGGGARPRIVGGTESTPFSYPFLTSIQLCESGKCGHECGGSLIAADFVLTAAHCFGKRAKPSQYKVMVHGHSLSMAAAGKEHACEESIAVKNIGCHASYDKNSMVADICLLRLRRTPKCFDSLKAKGEIPYLDADDAAASPGVLAIVAGWGSSTTKKGRDGYYYSDEQREATVPLIANAACSKKYLGPYPYYSYDDTEIFDDMLCAEH